MTEDIIKWNIQLWSFLFILISIIILLSIFLFLIHPTNIIHLEKSDCSWTICQGQDIQHCDWNEYLIAEHCCSGCTCSDTYYSKSENKCYLTLCESNPLGKDCTYEARK